MRGTRCGDAGRAALFSGAAERVDQFPAAADTELGVRVPQVVVDRPHRQEQLLRDLRSVNTGVATIGQYLQPTRRNLPVSSYVPVAQFDAYRDYGLSIGFKMVFSGPLVRSSYMADLVNEEASRLAV